MFVNYYFIIYHYNNNNNNNNNNILLDLYNTNWDHYYLQFIHKFDYRDILLEKSYTDHWLFRKLT